VPRPAKFDDADLLDRSYDLLWRDGCDAVSIRDLESALGLQAPSIYRRFHSRHELIARSVDRYVERVVGARVRRHLVDAEDPVAGLQAFFTSALVPAPGEIAPRGCLLTVTAGQVASVDPGVRAAVSAGVATVEDAFRTQVHRARDQGRLASGADTDADADAVATGLLLAFEGLLVLVRAGRTGLDHVVDGVFAAYFPTAAVPAATSTERTTDHE